MAKLSIIIPVYNMKKQLHQCILSVRKTVRLPYEVIIIDDGSSADEHVSIPVGTDDVRVIRNDVHMGFSHAVNAGIRASVGEVLFFLHADVLLTPHTAEDMLDALTADPSLGAVTAVAVRTYYGIARTQPDRTYQSWEEFIAVSEDMRKREKYAHPEIIAEMFALMVRRDVVVAAGFLDEHFEAPAFTGFDYTIRMTRAGFGVASLPWVYVHHVERAHEFYEEVFAQRKKEHSELFRDKWGVSIDYSFQARVDLLSMMELRHAGLRILEIGCACGATLREIAMHNPTAKLYGVELNENAAAIAAPFAQILSMNVEDLNPADIAEHFDYIIMGDVIEHLLDPWTAIRNIRELLVPGGSIVASIPNVAHISNLYNVLCGRWTYEDMGLLDRTHFRFFTKYEIIKMIEDAGLVINEIHSRKQPINVQWQALRDEILSLRSIHVDSEDVETFQWLFRVVRAE